MKTLYSLICMPGLVCKKSPRATNWIISYLYLSHPEICYEMEKGFNLEKAEKDIIL